MKPLAVALALACLVGCRSSIESIGCPKAVDTAVLRKLTLPNNDGVEAEMDPGICGDLDSEQAQIDSIRAWMPTISDRCVRAAYANWMWFYQVQLDEARSECRTHSMRRSQDAYEKSSKDEEEDVSQYEEQHPVPAPKEQRP